MLSLSKQILPNVTQLYRPRSTLKTVPSDRCARYDISRDGIRAAAERRMDEPPFLVLRYDLAFTQNDVGGMQAAVAPAQAKPDRRTCSWPARRFLPLPAAVKARTLPSP